MSLPSHEALLAARKALPDPGGLPAAVTAAYAVDESKIRADERARIVETLKANSPGISPDFWQAVDLIEAMDS